MRLEASGQATIVESHPELIITDHPPTASADAWQLEILRGPDAVSYQGPYVLDRSHPLTEGLSLEAVIWSAAPKAIPAGSPVVTAGNVVLLADSEDVVGRHKLQLAIDPDLSNLTDSPDWPILIANLVRWRLAALPGPAATNVRLGQPLRITLTDDAAAAAEATLVPPDGAEQKLAIHGKQLEIQPEQIGLYKVQAGSMRVEFACNALSPEESDLTKSATGKWGDWNESHEFQDQRVNIAWIFILLGIVALAAHAALLSRPGGTGT